MAIMLPFANFSSTQAVSILNSQESKRFILPSLDHAEVLERLLDCFFLIGRALGLFCIIGLRFVVIFSLDDTAFLLHLSDIQAADLESGMLQHIFLDFRIGGFLLCIGEIKFVHVDVYLDMLLCIKFGQ